MLSTKSMVRIASCIVTSLLILALTACTRKPREQRAYTAQESLAAMKISEDFTVEVFLTEPQVMSPVEMVFDENGRIYVAEMLDYPEDPPPGKPARSRIKLLEDTDGDGKYERTTIFADQVLQVSGLQPWKGGLIVTSAPDILWMKDNDGDGKADVRKVLYTGFPKVNPEARITNPRYAIDNWIYTSNNGRDGTITAPDHPERTGILVRGMDFRFHPIRDVAEPSSGVAQFGLTFDDWGNEFITENTTHLRHVILPMHYIAREPLLDVPSFALNIYEDGKVPAQIFPLTGPQEWRQKRTALRQQRYDERGLNRIEYVGGYFSGASGGTCYSGDAWPASYRGSIFTGEVSANLIHRDVINPDGMTFKAARAKEGVEFIASSDQWFRPCNFTNAPDGNLYFSDVYRLFIETPESIPEEIKKGMDFYAGDTLGRIYKIASRTPGSHRDLRPHLGTASSEELVKYLEHQNGWHRITAQRLLVERQDKTAIPLLRKFLDETKSAVGRVHALWTLEGLDALDDQVVMQALKDSDSHIREHALRLAERLVQKSQKTSPKISDAIIAMAGDADVRVQFQLALTLGQLKTERALNALVDLAARRSDNPWFRLAILSSVADRASQFFKLLRARGFEQPEMFAQLAALIGARMDTGELDVLLSDIGKLKQPDPVLGGLNKGLKLVNAKNLRVAHAEPAITSLLANPDEKVQRSASETARYFDLPGIVAKAIADSQNPTLDMKKRVNATRALRGGRFDSVKDVLGKLIQSDQSEVQIASIDALSSFDDPQVAPVLLGGWSKYSPGVRMHLLAAMLGERTRMKALMDAIEQGQIERTMIDTAMQAKLFDHPDEAVAERARAFFKQDTSERAAVVAQYRDVLNLKGDVNRGRQLFETSCAKCHIPQGGRPRIGADLSGINNKTREELLNSILNPSEAIEPRFVNYVVTTKDGRILDGILANETPGSITLRNAEADETILRRNIAQIRASRLSLMPDGFEKNSSKQALADLISYLRGGL